MSRGLRQLLVLFILLSGVMLAVLVVQVFFFGKRVPDDELTVVTSGLPESESPPESGTTPDEGDTSSPPDDTAPPADSTAASDNPPDGPPVADGMERVSIQIPNIGWLIVDYYVKDFVHDEREYGDEFLYISPDDGYAALSIMLLPNMSASDAPEFYSESDTPVDVTDGGTRDIGGTGLKGRYILAKSDTLTYEAWLVDIAGLGALAFEISYSDVTLRQIIQDQLDAVRLVA